MESKIKSKKVKNAVVFLLRIVGFVLFFCGVYATTGKLDMGLTVNELSGTVSILYGIMMFWFLDKVEGDCK